MSIVHTQREPTVNVVMLTGVRRSMAREIDDTAERVHVPPYDHATLALFTRLSDASATEAVRKWSITMGLDPAQPIAAQEMFAGLRKLAAMANDPEAKADAEFLRRFRLLWQGMGGKLVLAAATLLLTQALYLVWRGF